jgi:RND superfamily putative drug exporter
VFGAFIFGDERVIKEFGLGLSVAILIDASIVRMILVPATMELLGNANWWFPKWLSWLPALHVEGHAEDSDGIDAELAELVDMEKTAKR